MDGQQDISSSLAKEGRLTRMMESMKKKLDQLKSENAQLEDLLRQAEAASQGRASSQQSVHYFIAFDLPSCNARLAFVTKRIAGLARLQPLH